MSDIIMSSWGIYILIIILIAFWVTRGYSYKLTRKDIFAVFVCILMALIVRYMYDVAERLTFVDIEFGVAFLGGYFTLFVYNYVTNKKRASGE